MTKPRRSSARELLSAWQEVFGLSKDDVEMIRLPDGTLITRSRDAETKTKQQTPLEAWKVGSGYSA